MPITFLPVAKPREIHKPYIILAVLQFLDVASTWWILHYWSERAEGNPVVAAILNSVGLPIGMIIMLAFKMAMVYLLWTCQTGTKIALTLYVIVIFNNALYLLLWLLS